VDEVRIPLAGDGFYARGVHRRDARGGGPPRAQDDRREREVVAHGFHAPEYRAEIRQLMALGAEPPEENEA
jgi:hypothetical protein